MGFNPQDHYFKKAKALNYKARSVFKLEEIDQKFHLTDHVQTALDLGCAPGSWCQYLARKLGPQAKVVGVDLTTVDLKLANVRTFARDCFDPQFEEFLTQENLPLVFDLILSDMAPKTTGIKLTDQMRSLELCEQALSFCEKFLKPRGNFVCKFFHSQEFGSLRTKMKTLFQKVDVLKPESTRSMSKEIFLVGISKIR